MNLDFKSKWQIPSCAKKVRKYIQQHQISIVHSHLVLSSIIARLACPSHIKLYNTLHSPHGMRGPMTNFKIKWADKITYRKHHHILAVSQHVLHKFDETIGIKGPAHVLPNFVDDIYFDQNRIENKSGEKVFKLVAVGNLKSVKNYSFILEAFRFLSPAIRLDIYGDGHLKDELQNMIDGYDLPVRLCGMNMDMHNVLSNYDGFIMGSRYEGCPLSLLEAMATGLPLVLSDIPTMHEFAGNDALYFSLKDPMFLAQKISDLAGKVIDMNHAVKSNLQKAKRIASKKNYLSTLTNIYGGVHLPLEKSMVAELF